VTVSDKGDMGLMVGKIGIGATFEGPLVQVDRLPACGCGLTTGISLTLAAACTSDGRGAMFSFPVVCVEETLAFSVRLINDFLNHEGLEDEVNVVSVESFDPL
jgi:hypothetical protein